MQGCYLEVGTYNAVEAVVAVQIALCLDKLRQLFANYVLKLTKHTPHCDVQTRIAKKQDCITKAAILQQISHSNLMGTNVRMWHCEIFRREVQFSGI